MRLRVWIVVDMDYEPRPVAIMASPNRDAAVLECEHRNGLISRKRFKVFTASAEVSIGRKP